MATAAENQQSGNVGLYRALGLWNLIIIGMVIIQPTAPMGIYGVISNKAHGHVVTTIFLAMIAMLFTAISYGRMARVYPSAGSAYTYVGQEMHSALGYVVGWGMVMDYLINPLICTAFCAKAAMNILPGLSFYIWIIFFAAFFTWMNLRGIKTSAQLNEALCAGMVVVVLLFLGCVIRTVWHMHYDPGFFTHPFYDPANFHTTSIFAGTSVAVLTYIGFDAISTFSEEVRNPRRNILLATVLVCLITGLLSGLEVYAAQLIWGSKPFSSDNVESAFAWSAAKQAAWCSSRSSTSLCSSPTWVPAWARNWPPVACSTAWDAAMRFPNHFSAPSSPSTVFRATTFWRWERLRWPEPACSSSSPTALAEAPTRSAPSASTSEPLSPSWASMPRPSFTTGGSSPTTRKPSAAI